jgi:hypothetical protein
LSPLSLLPIAGSCALNSTISAQMAALVLSELGIVSQYSVQKVSQYSVQNRPQALCRDLDMLSRTMSTAYEAARIPPRRYGPGEVVETSAHAVGPQGWREIPADTSDTLRPESLPRASRRKRRLSAPIQPTKSWN